jgi:sialate O-acetylesterase
MLNASLAPLDNVGLGANYSWGVSSPETVGGPDWSFFSATCFYFGRSLIREDSSVPIGLIDSDWGGTIIEAWSSPDALSKCPSRRSAPVPDSLFSVEAEPQPNTPSVLWNAMIYPFLRMRLAAFVWYQGEANANDPNHYECSFPAMIDDWRAKFNETSLPFFFVQLAAYPDNTTDFAGLRIAQEVRYCTGLWGFPVLLTQRSQAALQLKNVGMATAIDLGCVSA